MLTIYDFNSKAQKCYEKIGFKTFGTRKRSHFANGEYHDTIYMDITREDFNKISNKNK
jgi:RimJ/RimL family protein N-acetyltransferase